ncbi:unnamed protein product [Absidia cylindrospora]
MDESYLPLKKSLNPFFAPGSHESSPSSSSPSGKVTIKQKLLSAFTTTSPPSSTTSTTSTTTTPTVVSATTTSTVTSTAESLTPTKSQTAKLFRIFETQSSKPKQSPIKCTPPQQLDQVNELPPQQPSPTASSATTVTITKSMNNIYLSDPDSIPTPRKASEWTTPSQSSPRPLTPKKSEPMEIDYDIDDFDDFPPLSQKNNKKQHTQLPWPDKMTFLGGHIKQSKSGDKQTNHTDGGGNILQYRRKEKPSFQLQQIVQAHGCDYLESLGKKRHAKSTTSSSSPSSKDTTSSSILSRLRISSPSSSSATSTSIQQQYASLTDQQGQLPYDIEEMMDALYPPDIGDGWQYPACEDLLNRYRRGEWKTTTDSTVDSNTNWCEKYRPKQVEYLLDNQSHHRYLRDWLERQKVAPSKAEASFFAPRKKVTRRAMEQHYNDDTDMHDNDDDDFMLTGSGSGGNKKKKATKKRKKDLNMILLVGSSGTGKTAGVFTAAHETGYQVFEIHPGIRRSLKDVVRLVGDMSKNHLVRFGGIKSSLTTQQRQSNGTCGDSDMVDDDDDDGDDDEGDDNNDSEAKKEASPSKPNQLLTHFFTPKTNIDTKHQHKPTTTNPLPNTGYSSAPKDVPAKQDQLSMTKSPTTAAMPSGPKQSLILLEEVDLIYQTDKGFWNGVTDLARTSKRPIILTCNDTSVIPFDILQLQAVIYYESPLRQLLLPFLHLICLMEGYLVPTAHLVTLVDMIGSDIRQLLTTLEYLHHYQGATLFSNDQQQKTTPKLHSSMLQAHMDLLMGQMDFHTLQQSWYHLSDTIPGAQLAPLCMQLAQNDPANNQSTVDIEGDDDDDLFPLLQTWLDNRSLFDYGIGMTEKRISQVYGMDEHGGKDDQESGYMHSWKKHSDWDHYEMEAYMESNLLELNQPQQGTGLVDIMSWEMICDQRNKQYENDLLSVDHMLNCRSNMALGGFGILDITYSKHIEHLRRTISRKRRRGIRRVHY